MRGDLSLHLRLRAELSFFGTFISSGFFCPSCGPFLVFPMFDVRSSKLGLSSGIHFG